MPGWNEVSFFLTLLIRATPGIPASVLYNSFHTYIIATDRLQQQTDSCVCVPDV